MTDGSTFQVSYVLDDVVEILRVGRNKKLFTLHPIRATILDDFLLSGRFNSVLGLDGFRIFKAELGDAVARLDDEPIAPARIMAVLLHSGVHYVDEHRPAGIPPLAADPRRPAAYRHLARGFSHLSSADFAVLVARLKATRGRSVHIETDDSLALRGLADGSELFGDADIRTALLDLGHRELRAICRTRGIVATRRLEETADRILADCGDDVSAYVPAAGNGRRSLVLRDQDLATGEDVVRLEVYLREVATALCEDLRGFVGARRHAPWLLEAAAS